MAITATSYNNFLVNLGSAVHNFTTDTTTVALLGTGYVPDYTNHKFFSDVSSNEISDSGYTAGGTALTGVTFSYVGGSGALLNANAVTWTDLTANVQYAVVYKQTATATGILIGLFDFGTARTYNSEPFQLSFPNGIVAVTAG